MNWDAYGKKETASRKYPLVLFGKKTICLLLAIFLFSSFQPLHAQTITLSLKEGSLQTAFKQIQAQSGYQFVYTSETLQETRPVTITIKDQPLNQVLVQLFSQQPLNYTVQDQYIIVKKKPGPSQHIPTHDVSGIIINEKNEPVSGATIQVKGKDRATASNLDGSFTLVNVEDRDVLVITSIGFRRTEYPLEGQTHVIIHLETHISTLDETVIIAYGTTTKKLNTGSISSIKSEEMEKQPVSNPVQALEGRMPGVYIEQITGVPGTNFVFRIRGQNSLRAGANDPLYIIDGVPFISTTLSSRQATQGILQGAGDSPLGALNPGDIESIEVLKDADATAIYGSRGANGVVLITTKKGKEGKTSVDFSYSTGFGAITHRMNLLHTPQYLSMRREAFFNDGASPQAWDYDVNGIWDTTHYTDWQKILIGRWAPIENAQAAISGGNANTQFLLGLGYYKEATVFPGDFHYQKTSSHLSLSHLSTNRKFQMSLTENFVAEENSLPSQDLTSLALSLPPDAPALYDSSGKINWANGTWPFDVSPLSSILQKYKGKTTSLIVNSLLSYTLLPGLKLKASLGYSTIQKKENMVLPISSFDPAVGISTGMADFGSSSFQSWIAEPQLEYSRAIHNSQLTTLLGITFQQNIQEGQTLLGSGFINDALLENLQSASSINSLASSYAQYRYSAVFGRINYNWKEKYQVNFTGRRDGSSRFGPGKQFANFGALGLGWIFSNEGYFKNHFPTLSFGKLRTSYGITGNDQIGDYQYLGTYSSTSFSYQGSGLFPNRLVNPDFAWEINRKLEVGLETGFWNNQLLFSADYYLNRSSNQLVGYALPSITGFTTVQANLPALVRNSGYEFQMGFSTGNNKTFSWNSSINISFPSNKLVSYPNIAGSAYANIYQVGKSLYVRKSYHSLGVNPLNGMYDFEDQNKDGQISYPEDLATYKQVAQQYYGGFQNTVSYKNFQLEIFIQFVRQTGLNYLSTGVFQAPGMFGNQPTEVLNHWQKPGDHFPVQAFTQDFGSAINTAYSNAVYSSDLVISDASFIRLKTVSLSWQLPQRWQSSLHLRKGTFYIHAQNLWTLTKYIGLDPENQSGFSLPPLRVISFGIQLSF